MAVRVEPGATLRIGVLLFLSAFLTGCAGKAAVGPLATITFLDVGQGDAAVIQTRNGKVVVLDGGGRPGQSEESGGDPGHRILLPFLRCNGIRSIDWLIATHPDEDHCIGLIPVAKHTNVKAALVGRDFIEGAAGRLIDILRKRRVPVHQPRAGNVIRLDDRVRLEFINPGNKSVPNSHSPRNDNGIVFKLFAGTTTALFVADLELAGEEQLIRSRYPLKSQLLKIGHHGSKTSTTPEFLRKVAPTLAVISVGRGNRYGHPSRTVLRRLHRSGVAVWRTDRNGAVTAHTDGSNWKLEGYLKQNGPAYAGP